MTDSFNGRLATILHLHIPFVLHADPMAREWLHQAVAESYIPLLNMMNRLIAWGKSPKLTIGITPPLLEQLDSDEFRDSFPDYLQQRMKAALNDALSFRHTKIEISFLARRWEEYYWSILYAYEKVFDKNLVGWLRRLHDEGHIELIASSATHAFMPLLSRESSIRAQVGTGVATYERYFGRRPAGFWLPECAYRPGIEEFLAEEGIRYFVVDSRQLIAGSPENNHRSPFRPHLLNTAKGFLAVLCRHFDTCAQVWDSSIGYPGDPWYLDFHKKHLPSMLRYWRVTGRDVDMADKELYREELAFNDRKEEHARHYVEKISGILEGSRRFVGRPEGVLTAFDGELFGHWWFEGPEWLGSVIQRVHDDPCVRLATALEFAEQVAPGPEIQLVESSWSDIGAHENWLRDEAKDLWKVIHAGEETMEYLTATCSNGHNKDVCGEILRQAGRELLLMESSDWLFMLTTGNTQNIARDQAKTHSVHFHQLAELLTHYCSNGGVASDMWSILSRCRRQDWVFPELDTKYWRTADQHGI